MSGVFFAVFVVAILVIIRWYIQNERIGPDSDGSKGLLAMRSPQEPGTGDKSDLGQGATRRFASKQDSPNSKPKR